MTLKKIDAKIGRVAVNGAKLNDLIHSTAVDILRHAEKHGDCTRALTLVMAMPASMRRTTLIAWFTKYSPIRVIPVNGVVGMLKKDEKGYKTFNVSKADENPFHKIAEMTPEQAAPMDFAALVALVKATAKRIEKAVDDGKVADYERDTALAMAKKLDGMDFKRLITPKAVEPSNDEVETSAPVLAAVA